MPQITVRSATLRDLPRIELANSSSEIDVERLLEQQELGQIDYLVAQMRRMDGLSFVGQLVVRWTGFDDPILHRRFRSAPSIEYLNVAKKDREQIVNVLLHEAQRRIKLRGHREFFVTVQPRKPTLRTMLQNFGFEFDKEPTQISVKDHNSGKIRLEPSLPGFKSLVRSAVKYKFARCYLPPTRMDAMREGLDNGQTEAYLELLGLQRQAPSLEYLAKIQERHRKVVPLDCLWLYLNEDPSRGDPSRSVEYLLRTGRLGSIFSRHEAAGAFLASLGFRVRELRAGVQAANGLPRSTNDNLCLVEVSGLRTQSNPTGTWIFDVGTKDGSRYPLAVDVSGRQNSQTHQVRPSLNVPGGIQVRCLRRGASFAYDTQPLGEDADVFGDVHWFTDPVIDFDRFQPFYATAERDGVVITVSSDKVVRVPTDPSLPAVQEPVRTMYKLGKVVEEMGLGLGNSEVKRLWKGVQATEQALSLPVAAETMSLSGR
jgi:hypothetical protein